MLLAFQECALQMKYFVAYIVRCQRVCVAGDAAGSTRLTTASTVRCEDVLRSRTAMTSRRHTGDEQVTA